MPLFGDMPKISELLSSIRWPKFLNETHLYNRKIITCDIVRPNLWPNFNQIGRLQNKYDNNNDNLQRVLADVQNFFVVVVVVVYLF